MKLAGLVAGLGMMKFLVCCYIFTALLFALERNWPKVMYWIGAAIITSSVIWMK